VQAGVDVLNRLMDRLDANDKGGRNRNRRSNARHPYRRLDVPARFLHPGGSAVSRVVVSRNLSAGGIALLYPGFLHKGTAVELTLRRTFGGEDVAHGSVVFCAHCVGVFHQVGVRFDAKIFPELYVDLVV